MGALTQRGPLGATTKTTAEMLERILDKGILVMGDIRIALLDIELLTVKLRLAVMTLDKAIELHERGLSPFGIPLVSEDRMFGGVGEPQLGQALGPMDVMEKRLSAIESRLEQLLGGGAVPLEERRRQALPAAQPAMEAPQQQQALPEPSGVPQGDRAREAQPAQQRPEPTNPFGGPTPPFGGPAAEPGRSSTEVPPPASASELEKATQRYRQAAAGILPQEKAANPFGGPAPEPRRSPAEVAPPSPTSELEQATQRYRQAAAGILPQQKAGQQTAPRERERRKRNRPGRSPAEVAPPPLPKLEQATQRYRQAAAGILSQQLGAGERAA